MKKEKNRWRDEAGSIDFMQVIVGLLIVGIASVGTFQALNYGNDQMNYQMRYRKALSIARSQVEYWQGRIHTDFEASDLRTRQGNLGQQVDPTILDLGDLDREDDDVVCFVRYGPITPVFNQELGVDRSTGQPQVSHWVIRIHVTWWEPDQASNSLPQEVTFEGSMVPAAL